MFAIEQLNDMAHGTSMSSPGSEARPLKIIFGLIRLKPSRSAAIDA